MDYRDADHKTAAISGFSKNKGKSDKMRQSKMYRSSIFVNTIN